MKIILQPHTEPYFGQDFTTRLLIKGMGLVPKYLINGEYKIDDIETSNTELIISRYPDKSEDIKAIKAFYKKIPIAIHFHLRYNFYTNEQKHNISDILKHASLRITNCRDLCNDYKIIFPEYDWNFINNGVDSLVFKPTTITERYNFKIKNKIGKDRILISYVGRLNNPKGLQILYRICDFVSSSDTHWLVIQTIFLDKYLPIIQEIKKKYKHVTIYLEQELKVVRYSDVHLNTSLSETTSLVNLEALFSGVPVICTAVTDFYKELDFLNGDINSLIKISMPNYHFKAHLSKSSLNLTEEETNIISKDFIGQIKTLRPRSDQQRLILAAKLKNTSFDSLNMIKSIKNIYDRIQLRK